jgi:hypothetical protein
MGEIRGLCHGLEGGSPIQIQEDFAETPLSVLSRLGLEIYALIPDYRDCCPLCLGRDCAVRHGLYHRPVIDQDGRVYADFPVPRFKCRRKGARCPGSVTFSVLPSQLVSRRRVCLPLVVRVLSLFLDCDSLARALDALSDADGAAPVAWFPERVTVYRLVRLSLRAEHRLRSAAPAPARPSPAVDLRGRVRGLLSLVGSPARAAPCALGFHRRHFPQLLFSNAS